MYVAISQKKFDYIIFGKKNDKKQNERKSWVLTVWNVCCKNIRMLHISNVQNVQDFWFHNPILILKYSESVKEVKYWFCMGERFLKEPSNFYQLWTNNIDNLKQVWIFSTHPTHKKLTIQNWNLQGFKDNLFKNICCSLNLWQDFYQKLHQKSQRYHSYIT